MKEALKTYLVGQFGKPHGLMGMIAGWIMARRDSNRRRNLWTIDLMALEPHHHVLEIGYGPGFALQQACRKLTEGMAVGLDHSHTMCRMARARNRLAVEQGRLKLKVGSADDLEHSQDAALRGPFDRIFAANVAMFWADPVKVLRALAGRLSIDGRIYLTFQPRMGDKTDEASLAAAEKVAAQMRSAGLTEVDIETLRELAPMAVCVVGRMAEKGTQPPVGINEWHRG